MRIVLSEGHVELGDRYNQQLEMTHHAQTDSQVVELHAVRTGSATVAITFERDINGVTHLSPCHQRSHLVQIAAVM